VLHDDRVFELMEAAAAAGNAIGSTGSSVFDFLADAQSGGVVAYAPLVELTDEDADRLLAWIRGCAQVAHHTGDVDWLTGQAVLWLCEARAARQQGQRGQAVLKARLAESAAALLARAFSGMDSRGALDEIERWR
jgi:hypothetical protein